jgi:uncharacterized protein
MEIGIHSKKKFLFFLSHPAHFHFFKNVIKNLKESGFEIIVVIKEKDILRNLIEQSGIPYVCIQRDENLKRKNSRFSILFNAGYSLLKRDWGLFKIVKDVHPDLLIGSETSIAHIGKLFNIPSIIINEDDWNIQKEFVYPTYPFSTVIVAPRVCNVGRWEKKKIAYEGYQKLSYLHPDYFYPDRSVLNELSPQGKPYIIIRSVSMTAHHDSGKKGLTPELTDQLIKKLEPDFQIWLTVEGDAEEHFKKYLLKLPQHKIHHALYFSRLLIGDSQSMSVEASMLGVPSIRISDFSGKISVLNELEDKYKLSYGITPGDNAALFELINKILYTETSEIYRSRSAKMISEKINVTKFLTWLFSEYPESVNYTKKNINWQEKFSNENLNYTISQ